MKEELLDYIEDAINAMVKAESFIEGMDFDTFSKDEKTIFAVIRALEVLGEAVKRIPDEIRERYAQIPWRAMAGMRDKLIHGYNQVNLVLVWETVKTHIPSVKPTFQEILEDHLND